MFRKRPINVDTSPENYNAKKKNVSSTHRLAVNKNLVQVLGEILLPYLKLPQFLKLKSTSRLFYVLFSGYFLQKLASDFELLAKRLPVRLVLQQGSHLDILTQLLKKEQLVEPAVSSVDSSIDKFANFFKTELTLPSIVTVPTDRRTQILMQSAVQLLQGMINSKQSDNIVLKLFTGLLAYITNDTTQPPFNSYLLGDLNRQGFLTLGLLLNKDSEEYKKAYQLLLSNLPRQEFLSDALMNRNICFCFALNYVHTVKVLNQLLDTLGGLEPCIIIFLDNLDLQEVYSIIFDDRVRDLVLSVFQAHAPLLMAQFTQLREFTSEGTQKFNHYILELFNLFRLILSIDTHLRPQVLCLSVRTKQILNFADYFIIYWLSMTCLEIRDWEKISSLDDFRLGLFFTQVFVNGKLPEFDIFLFRKYVSCFEHFTSEQILHINQQQLSLYEYLKNNVNLDLPIAQVPPNMVMPRAKPGLSMCDNRMPIQYQFVSQTRESNSIQLTPNGGTPLTQKDLIGSDESAIAQHRNGKYFLPESEHIFEFLSFIRWPDNRSPPMRHLLDPKNSSVYQLSELTSNPVYKNHCYVDFTWVARITPKTTLSLGNCVQKYRRQHSASSLNFVSGETFMGFLTTLSDYEKLLKYCKFPTTIEYSAFNQNQILAKSVSSLLERPERTAQESQSDEDEENPTVIGSIVPPVNQNIAEDHRRTSSNPKGKRFVPESELVVADKPITSYVVKPSQNNKCTFKCTLNKSAKAATAGKDRLPPTVKPLEFQSFMQWSDNRSPRMKVLLDPKNSSVYQLAELISNPVYKDYCYVDFTWVAQITPKTTLVLGNCVHKYRRQHSAPSLNFVSGETFMGFLTTLSDYEKLLKYCKFPTTIEYSTFNQNQKLAKSVSSLLERPERTAQESQSDEDEENPTVIGSIVPPVNQNIAEDQRRTSSNPKDTTWLQRQNGVVIRSSMEPALKWSEHRDKMKKLLNDSTVYLLSGLSSINKILKDICYVDLTRTGPINHHHKAELISLLALHNKEYKLTSIRFISSTIFMGFLATLSDYMELLLISGLPTTVEYSSFVHKPDLACEVSHILKYNNIKRWLSEKASKPVQSDIVGESADSMLPKI